MLPCLSGATIMPASFAQDVAFTAEASCSALEVWLPKLERHLDEEGLEATRSLLAARNVRPVAASLQGGLLLAQGEKRKAHFEHFRKRLEICQALGIPTLVLAADFVDAVDAVAMERAVVSLAQAAQWADACGVRLALEFQSRGAFCTCLETALALVQHCGEPNVGVNLDVFHYQTGPSKSEDLAQLPVDKLYHVQLCDVAAVPRELAADADRILPGDGDFPLERIVAALRGMGYCGPVSLEVLNPMLWQGNLQQLAEVGVTALRRCLGLARMG